MRFWSPFHRYSLDIISDYPRKLIFRAPNPVRLRMTVDHLQSNANPGSCLTQYNHDTCLWECYHSPETIGHHRLFIWLLNSDSDDQWATAVRFDVYVEQIRQAMFYPLTNNLFNSLRCQLLTPMQGRFSRDSLPAEILIRIPCIRHVQLQIDEQKLIAGHHLSNDIYRIPIPLSISDHVKNFMLMALCFHDTFYSILITYTIE